MTVTLRDDSHLTETNTDGLVEKAGNATTIYDASASYTLNVVHGKKR
jgi:hypothetical protein